MKSNFLILFILSLVTITGFSQAGRKNKDANQPGKKDRTEMLVNSKTFVFHARRAIPSGGNAVDLTTNPNYVKFKPDYIDSYMPFFGRAYSGVGYGGDQGLHFNGQPQEFNVEKSKNGYQVTANVKGDRDNFRLSLSVTQDGSATLSIISNNRQSITYMGEISEK